MGGVRQRRKTPAWFWAVSLLLFCGFSAVLAQTAQEVRELLQWGDNEMALERAEKGLEKNPGDDELRFYQALAMTRTGAHDDALDILLELAGKYPDHPEIHNNLAVLYAQDGNYDEARASLEAALATDEAYATAHKNLADIYSAQAAAAYNRALARDEARDVPRPQLDLLSNWTTTPAETMVAAQNNSKAAPDKKPAGKPASEPAVSPAKEKPAKAAKDKQPLKLISTADTVETRPLASKEALKETPTQPTRPGKVLVAAEAAEPEAASPEPVKVESPKTPEPVPAPQAVATENPEETAKTKSEPPEDKPDQEPVEVANQQNPAGQDADKAKASETASAESVIKTPALPVIAPEQAQRAARAVENWAAAWQAQDIEGYLASYAGFFRPENGITHDEWAAQRRVRVAKPEYIRIGLRDMRIRLKGWNKAVANFQQEYQSNTYQDAVNKVLYLELIDGKWLIVREVSEPD